MGKNHTLPQKPVNSHILIVVVSLNVCSVLYLLCICCTVVHTDAEMVFSHLISHLQYINCNKQDAENGWV